MNITICDTCGLELDDDQLTTCAADVYPWLEVPDHCFRCLRECPHCTEQAATPRLWRIDGLR